MTMCSTLLSHATIQTICLSFELGFTPPVPITTIAKRALTFSLPCKLSYQHPLPQSEPRYSPVKKQPIFKRAAKPPQQASPRAAGLSCKQQGWRDAEQSKGTSGPREARGEGTSGRERLEARVCQGLRGRREEARDER
ncbi:hypothetical protein OIU84_023939, partial [Salix udensis]